jgi:prepilin-type N-terminal cleavage/methylation domain-containing protein/prepilin-type processing-associated H-X9-DG protein
MNGNTKQTRRHRDKGFTLIELLVVIAVIAVLLGILMPSLRKARQTARTVVCKSNLRNVGLAVHLYVDDNNRRIPDTGSSNGHLWIYPSGKYRTPGSGGGTYWGTFYRTYIKETKIFGCPSLQRVPEGLIYSYNDFPDPAAVVQHAAYGINHHHRARNNRKVSTIYRTDEFLYASDHAEPRPDGGSSDCFHNNDTPGAMNLTSYRQGGSRSYTYRQIFRHNIRRGDPYETGGRANLLWLDGHVSSLRETTGDDFKLRWYTGDKPERGEKKQTSG